MSEIVRIWKGTTKTARADEYAAYLSETGVKEMVRTPGNNGVLVLRRRDHDLTEFYFVSFWNSLEAITRFAGSDIQKAVFYPEDRKFLEKFETEVEHFEIAISESPDKRRIMVR